MRVGVVMLVVLGGCYTSLDVSTVGDASPTDTGYAGEGLPLLYPEHWAGFPAADDLRLGLACSFTRCILCGGHAVVLGLGEERSMSEGVRLPDSHSESRCHAVWDGERFIVVSRTAMTELDADGRLGATVPTSVQVWAVAHGDGSFVVASPVGATGIAISTGPSPEGLSQSGVVPLRSLVDHRDVQVSGGATHSVLAWREAAAINTVEIADGRLSSPRILAAVGEGANVAFSVAQRGDDALLALGVDDHIDIIRVADREIVGALGPSEPGVHVRAVDLSATESGFFLVWSERRAAGRNYVLASRLDAGGSPLSTGFDQTGSVVAEATAHSYPDVVAARIGMSDELVAHLTGLGYMSQDHAKWRRVEYPEDPR